MGNLHLVTGYAGVEHVTAADHASLHAALFGEGEYVLNRGSKFAATIISNNSIRVADGDIIMQGRHIRLNEGNYVDLAVENGTQGLVRNDLIVARYTKNSVTGVEDCSLVVIKGTASEGTATDPDYTDGDIINDHVLVAEMPLYRVRLNGLNVQNLVELFEVFEMNSANHEHSASSITRGTLSADRLPVVPVAKGGTGATTIAAARNILGLGNTSGALPVANGGTGMTTAEEGLLALGGNKFVKLWENASPSSEFSAQTINLTLTGYTHIAVQTITSNAEKANGNYQPLILIPNLVGTSGAISSCGCDGSDAMWIHTRFTEITSTGVKFSDGHMVGLSNAINKYFNRKDRAIPVIIYGIKGVTI